MYISRLLRFARRHRLSVLLVATVAWTAVLGAIAVDSVMRVRGETETAALASAERAIGEYRADMTALRQRAATAASGLDRTDPDARAAAGCIGVLPAINASDAGTVRLVVRSRPDDAWTAAALDELRRGASEVTSVAVEASGRHIHLLEPVVMTASCTDCHSATASPQAALLAEVPMGALDIQAEQRQWQFGVGYFLLWTVSVAFAVAFAIVLEVHDGALAKSEKRYRSLFDRGPHPTFVLRYAADGGFGAFIQVNDAACETLQYERSRLLSMSPRDVFTDLDPSLEEALAGSVKRRDRIAVGLTMRDSQGASRKVRAGFSDFPFEGGPAVLLSTSDFGDRRVAEQAVRSRTRQLEVLSSATRRINEDLDVAKVLRVLVSAAIEITSATGGLAALVEDDELVFGEYVDKDAATPVERRVSRGEGACGWVWETAAPYIANDVPRDPRCRHGIESSLEAMTLIAVPIIDRQSAVVGCLLVHDRVGGQPFTTEDVTALTGLVSSAVAALENARFVDELINRRVELLDYQMRLQSLTRELSRTSQRERRRIANELHDQIGQTLAIARIKLGQAGAPQAEEATARLAEARELLDQAIVDTRHLVFELSPPLLYELGLPAALEWLCEQVQERHGVETSFVEAGEYGGLSDDLRALVYVCTRELMLNVVKHAYAQHLVVSLDTTTATLRVRVADDGEGFVPSDGTATSFGLFSVRERLEGFGGRLDIASAPGRGTAATIEVPWDVTPLLR